MELGKHQLYLSEHLPLQEQSPHFLVAQWDEKDSQNTN